MARDPDTLFDRAGDTLDSGGWRRLLETGFGTIFLAWVYSTADLMGSFFESLFAPVRALMSGFAEFISGTVGAGVGVIEAGGVSSEQSLLHGIGSFAGPFAFPLGVFSVVIALLIVDWWWDRTDVVPWGHLVDKAAFWR